MRDRRARFEEIYNAYSGLILAYAAQRTSDARDAADVVAETFLVAWRRIDDVPTGHEARPWLYGVARRTLANLHRADRRRRRLDQRAAADLTVTMRSAATEDHGPDHEVVAAAFGALGEADRELLALMAWDGLDRDEIAAVLGCSRANVRVRLHRARRRFARELERAGLQRSAPAGHGCRQWSAAHPRPEEP